jgi:hypothetical protein
MVLRMVPNCCYGAIWFRAVAIGDVQVLWRRAVASWCSMHGSNVERLPAQPWAGRVVKPSRINPSQLTGVLTARACWTYSRD